ncbi:MAG: DUF5692 family protein [Eggerthellaceae bacterium]
MHRPRPSSTQAIGKAHWFGTSSSSWPSTSSLWSLPQAIPPGAPPGCPPASLYGGWVNVFNGVAGIINIACMTGWFGILHIKSARTAGRT